METEIPFWKFCEQWFKAVKEFPSYRRGQCLIYALMNIRPELAEAIRGTHLDPFYCDDRIEDTLLFLSDFWDD